MGSVKCGALWITLSPPLGNAFSLRVFQIVLLYCTLPFSANAGWERLGGTSPSCFRLIVIVEGQHIRQSPFLLYDVLVLFFNLLSGRHSFVLGHHK